MQVICYFIENANVISPLLMKLGLVSKLEPESALYTISDSEDGLLQNICNL